MLRVRDAAALPVHEEVIALARRELLDPRKPLPAPGPLRPRFAPHDHVDLVGGGELTVGLDLDRDDVYARAHLAQGAADGIDDFRVVVRVDRDEHAYGRSAS